MTVDDRQNVVEVMGDPAGELADGFHLLRLAQLLFQPLLSRDVPEQPQQHRGLASQLDKRTGVLQSHDIAVTQGQAAFMPSRLNDRFAEALAEFLEHLPGLLGVGEDDREGLALDSSRGMPTSLQKASLTATMFPCSSVRRIPSTEFSHTEWNSISELRSAASASLRSVMSRTCNSTAGWPA
jgi:hypothetical protein